ncbi:MULTISPECIES: membrane protein insertase YidC [unclassified Motilimonas]|uniref:membrane protein insertase YidC n=1 Tax=Motilimonas TaxID=1914248 RepID=UPI001E550956|nr:MULTISPECIES: membrane protein insertase YidC [unclassified Motilimonas]MCE0557773.1 membrane protein insertase YidC [Motilimonas sp. E26]MDO6525915.1 membrane protein insertase YidC [Motilimonas sp. 1_MG-2023]
MESQRNFLLIGLLFVSYLIFVAWTEFKNPQPEQPTVVATQPANNVPSSANISADVPMASADANQDVPVESNSASQKRITLSNDTLKLVIDTVGGDIVEADLLLYPEVQGEPAPFKLLKSEQGHTYIAQSGLIGQGPDSHPKGRPHYTTTQDKFILSEGADKVSAQLYFTTDTGIKYVKVFTLLKGKYEVDIDYQVINNSDAPVNLQLYGQLKQTVVPSGGSLVMPVYRGGAYSAPLAARNDTRYTKYPFDDMQEANLAVETKGGYVAMLEHYFVSAFIPSEEQTNELYTRVYGTDAAIGYKAPLQTVAAGSEATLSTKLWVGPKLQDEMAEVGTHLDLTVDYGWLWFIAQPLFQLLLFFQSIVGNWGVAIILVTFAVKGVMYPLTKAQYTSMAKMRLLQPKIQQLRDRYGEDKQKVSQGMMELYKKEKVNPLGGCLPILLQMPIFIALYWSLMESVELRHAPFFGWITDLSVQDPYYVLPILMGISMFFIQKMSPTTVQDPMQAKIMQYMPVVFTAFFLFFPSGLVLYWLVSNLVTLLQQWLIFRELDKKGLGKNASA